MKKVSLALCCATLLVSHLLHAQVTATDVCYAMAKNAVRDISVSASSEASTAALYDNYCHADGSTDESAIGASGKAIVDSLPIGAAFSQKDNHTRFAEFCRQYQSSTASQQNRYSYQSVIVAKALDSVNQCINAATHSFALSYRIITPNTLAIHFGIPAGQTLTVHGIKPDTGVTCTGNDYKNGGVFNYGQGVGQSINSLAADDTITCVRDPMPTKVADTQFYSEKAVLVSTSAGPLDIYWPQDTVLPIVTASAIQNSINTALAALTQQIQTVQQQVQGVQGITSALKPAQYFERPYSQMQKFHPACDDGKALAGNLSCGAAAQGFCQSQGFTGGFPQQTNPNVLGFVCVK